MEASSRLIEMILDDTTEGVFAVSFVGDPAIESNFIALTAEQVNLAVQQDKQTVTGAILIPDIPILRMGTEPYHVFFTKETISRISERYLTNHKQDSVTLQHATDVNDVVMIESWIKTDDVKDKSVALGIEAPIGTWFGTFKVNNDELWNNEVKTGNVKGFSIEGLFKQKTVKMENVNLLQELKDFVKSILNPSTVVEEMAAGDGTGPNDPMPEPAAGATVPELEQAIAAHEVRIAELEARIAALEPAEVEDVVEEEMAVAVVEEQPIVEEVEMVIHTDVPVERQLKIKYNPKLTTQERIKMNLGILKN